MFLKCIMIFICFQIALSSKLHSKIFNNAEDFVRLNGYTGSDDHAPSLDKEILTNQTICGMPAITPNTLRRIIGSEEALPNSWPWQVSVYGKYHVHGHFLYVCDGTIISANQIITAAHCLFDRSTGFIKAKNLFVIAGIHDNTDYAKNINSQKKMVNWFDVQSTYNPAVISGEGDIAILFLESPGFTFNAKVQPACLPTSHVPVGTNCYTTGWGDISSNQINDYGKLYQAKVPIISHNDCLSWFGRQIRDNMVCAGSTEGGKYTCERDGGRSLVCNRDGVWVLTGVVSFGNGCGQPINLEVYTDVYSYISWINR